MPPEPLHFGKFIERQRLALRMKKRTLARLVGCDPSTIGNIEDREEPDRTQDTNLAGLARELFGTSEDEMLKLWRAGALAQDAPLGKPPVSAMKARLAKIALVHMEEAWEAHQRSLGVPVPLPPLRRIRLFRSVSAVRKDLREDGEGEEIDFWTRDAEAFGVKLDGACMSPDFPDGRTVICSVTRWKAEGFVDGKEYWVRFEDGESTFKRVHIDKMNHDVLVMTPLNGEPWKVRRKDVALAARAIGILLLD